jgi:hypothetical protein
MLLRLVLLLVRLPVGDTAGLPRRECNADAAAVPVAAAVAGGGSDGGGGGNGALSPCCSCCRSSALAMGDCGTCVAIQHRQRWPAEAARETDSRCACLLTDGPQASALEAYRSLCL